MRRKSSNIKVRTDPNGRVSKLLLQQIDAGRRLEVEEHMLTGDSDYAEWRDAVIRWNSETALILRQGFESEAEDEFTRGVRPLQGVFDSWRRQLRDDLRTLGGMIELLTCLRATLAGRGRQRTDS
jgi:hypothetical protein